MDRMAGGNLEYTDLTLVHPLGLAVLLVCILYSLFGPRRYAIVPLLVIFTFIPSAQRLTIAGLDFTFLRLVVIFLTLRILAKGEARTLVLSTTDKLLIFYVIWGIFSFGVLYGSFSSVVTRTGYMLEVAGTYFVGRALLRDWTDLKRCLIAFGVLALPLAALFLIENRTGRNLFSVFGGVPEITPIRDGRVRSQGPFSHPIIAGVFWAILLPLIFGLWRSGMASKRKLAVFFIASVLIIVSTASSTPVIAIFLAIAGTGMYLVRKYMTAIKWSVIIVLGLLHLVMSAPVWHLLARVNVVGGSTGWHRYFLIDRAIQNFSEWMLIGTRSTADWGSGLRDVTNQYILEGVRGGALGLLLFTLFMRSIFVALRRQSKVVQSPEEQKLLWSLWAVMFVHMISFIAVAYFGSVVGLFFLLAGGTVSLTMQQKAAGGKYDGGGA